MILYPIYPLLPASRSVVSHNAYTINTFAIRCTAEDYMIFLLTCFGLSSASGEGALANKRGPW